MPLSIFRHFPKWPPSVLDEHEIFFCGAILTIKRAFSTNSFMGIPFVAFCFYHKHILDPEIQDSRAISIPYFVGLFQIIKRKF